MASTTKTETMKISDVRSEFNSLVNRVHRGETRVIVEKSGIPVAALVPINVLEVFDQEQKRQAAFNVLHEIGAAFKDVPLEEIEREVAKAIAEVRAEKRAERLRASVDTK